MYDEKDQAPQTTPENRGHSLLTKWIVEGTTILTGLTALLFMTGWLYVDGYYERFNLDPGVLNLPTSSLLLYAMIPVTAFVAVLVKPLPYLWIVVLPALIYWRASRTFRGRILKSWLARKTPSWLSKDFVPAPHLTPTEELWIARYDRYELRVMIVLVVIVLCTLLLVSAHDRGQKEGTRELRNPSTAVWLSFDESASKGLENALIQANADHKLMLLAQTKDLSVVFIKSTGEKLQDGLFIIPLAKLSAVHTQRLHPYK